MQHGNLLTYTINSSFSPTDVAEMASQTLLIWKHSQAARGYEIFCS